MAVKSANMKHIMGIVHAIILGIVEGVTEFLPISSTGHLILASRLLDLGNAEFIKTFEIFIQCGAIAAVLTLYWKQLLLNKAVMKRVVIAFIPAAAIGFILYKFIKHFLIGNDKVVIVSLLLGGIVLIAFEKWHRPLQETEREIESMTYVSAFLIGAGQAVAVIPGVSRSAATILAGLFSGLSRKAAVEFSFLLAAPTIAAAAAYDFFKTAPSFNNQEFLLLAIGCAVSFIIAMVTIKLFLAFVRSRTFIPFGVYRILAALAFIPFMF